MMQIYTIFIFTPFFFTLYSNIIIFFYNKTLNFHSDCKKYTRIKKAAQFSRAAFHQCLYVPISSPQ